MKPLATLPAAAALVSSEQRPPRMVTATDLALLDLAEEAMQLPKDWKVEGPHSEVGVALSRGPRPQRATNLALPVPVRTAWHWPFLPEKSNMVTMSVRAPPSWESRVFRSSLLMVGSASSVCVLCEEREREEVNV